MTLHPYVRNPLKRAVAEQLFKAQRGVCQLCQGEKRLEIDHIDGNPANWSFENLRLLCHECNISERNRQGSVQKGEGVQADRFTLTVITESPHNPTAKQRGLWDDWIRGKATVPTHDQFEFPLLRGLKSNPPMRIFEKARFIAQLAVHACGFGSNKTYWDYEMEDVAAKMFELKVEKGEFWVAYSEEFAEVVIWHMQEKAKKP